MHGGIEESERGTAASLASGCKPAPKPGTLLTVPVPVPAEAAGHVPAVLAALLVLVLLVLLAVLYVQCRLNVLLWYRDRYGELEINGEPEVTPCWEQPPALRGLTQPFPCYPCSVGLPRREAVRRLRLPRHRPR